LQDGKHVRQDNIQPTSDLGVFLDIELTMDEAVHQCCQCHILSNLAIEESMLHGTAITASLVSAFVVMRLGYCNVVLAGLPASTIAPLRQVQNVAA